MLIADERAFLKKVKAIYRRQKQRAAKDHQQLGYTAEALVAKARAAVTCSFCQVCLTTESLSFDHSKPVSRGGPWALFNLEAVCLRCNQAKGPLTHDEFARLMVVVLMFPPQAQTSVLSRLRAGGARIYGRAKR